MKAFGTRQTYQIFAASTLLTGCIYFLFNRFYIRKRFVDTGVDLYKKKPPVLDVECRETLPNELEKPNDAVAKVDADKSNTVNANNKAKEKVIGDTTPGKLVADTADGGSDSGVDNPAYVDAENASETKIENGKVN